MTDTRIKLDARQMALLAAMAKWPINAEGGAYRCVGSGRIVPIRYDMRTLPRMVALGLCSQMGSIFRATEVGLAAWLEQGEVDIKRLLGDFDERLDVVNRRLDEMLARRKNSDGPDAS
jgi:hypothetical protein